VDKIPNVSVKWVIKIMETKKQEGIEFLPATVTCLEPFEDSKSDRCVKIYLMII
jgi:hypothetical protein